jgi:RNA polymerase sigma-70 factor (ECF subfamily)
MSYALPTACLVGPVSGSSPSPAPRAPVVARDAASLRAALVALVPELRARALRLSGNGAVAEDLAQDTVERALRFADQYERGTNLRAWVHQILFSVFVTRCRRARLERKAIGVLTTDPCAWTSGDAARPEMQDLSPSVRRALDGLPAGFRQAVVLVDIEEMSYKAAADQLQIPVGTVMSRLHRGRRALAEAMRASEPVAHAA